jgi:hypothetical protein
MREVVMTKKGGKAGTRKRVTNMEAKALVLLGRALYAEDAQAAAPAPKATKRAYNRRDMVAATAATPVFGQITSPTVSSTLVTKSGDGEAS